MTTTSRARSSTIARGLTVRRYTGDQLEAEAEAIVADLREALGAAS